MLWFVVNTDLTITTEKVADLFSTLEYEFVDRFGDFLDLPKSKIDEIERNHHSPAQRRDACCDVYVSDHPCPSWRQVARVLGVLLLTDQAGIVESTYLQGTVILHTVLIHCMQSARRGHISHTFSFPHRKYGCLLRYPVNSAKR